MVPGAASRSDVTQLKVSQRRSPLVSGGYWQIALAHPHARRAETGSSLQMRASDVAGVGADIQNTSLNFLLQGCNSESELICRYRLLFYRVRHVFRAHSFAASKIAGV